MSAERPSWFQQARDRFLGALPFFVVLLWVAWLFGVMAHGAGYVFLTPKVDYVRAGQFGDAFGTLSSLMAALAATGAFLALRHQRTTSRDQSEALNRQSFESTLFHLFNVLNEKTQGIVFTTTSVEEEHLVQNEHRGPDAFSRFLELVSEGLPHSPTLDELGSRYAAEYSDVEGNLAHYFRMVYHILIFIHDHPSLKSLDERYQYVRFLRAQLSAPEMITVLLNCLFGGGRGQFMLLASDYDFFQHVSESGHPLGKHLVYLIPPADPTVEELKARQADPRDPSSFRRVRNRDDSNNLRYNQRLAARWGSIGRLDLRRRPKSENEPAPASIIRETDGRDAEVDLAVASPIVVKTQRSPEDDGIKARRREAALKGWATRRAHQTDAA